MTNVWCLTLKDLEDRHLFQFTTGYFIVTVIVNPFLRLVAIYI